MSKLMTMFLSHRPLEAELSVALQGLVTTSSLKLKKKKAKEKLKQANPHCDHINSSPCAAFQLFLFPLVKTSHSILGLEQTRRCGDICQSSVVLSDSVVLLRRRIRVFSLMPSKGCLGFWAVQANEAYVHLHLLTDNYRLMIFGREGTSVLLWLWWLPLHMRSKDWEVGATSHPILKAPSSPRTVWGFHLCIGRHWSLLLDYVWLCNSNSIAPALTQALIIPIGSQQSSVPVLVMDQPFILHWSSHPRKKADHWLL